MWKHDKQFIHTTLTHFEDKTRDEIFDISTHIGTITKSIAALTLGFIFFFPAVQVVLGTLLLYILFYPDTWKALAKAKAVEHKKKAIILLALSDLIINADTIFIIASAAYISMEALIGAVVFLALFFTLVKRKRTKEGNIVHRVPKFLVLLQVYSAKIWNILPVIRSYTWNDFVHFCWIGAIAFQATYMIVSDSLIIPFLSITTGERVQIAVASEILMYVIFFWRWGVIQNIYRFLFRLGVKNK